METHCSHSATLQPAFLPGNDLSDKQLAANTNLFASVSFASDLVPAGSGMVFNASVAHHGVENIMNHDRIVALALFGPRRIEKNADKFQRFPLGATPIEE